MKTFRTIIALPVVLVVCFLFVATALLALLADLIMGRSLSGRLFNW